MSRPRKARVPKRSRGGAPRRRVPHDVDLDSVRALIQPVGADHRAWLLERQQDVLEEAPELRPLIDRILGLAGLTVLTPVVEEHLRPLLERGEVFSGRDPVRMTGAAIQCHMNTARLWEANRSEVSIVTGYALSDDGIWRQHSWGFMKGTGRVVETTEDRLLYYGCRLTDEESEQFHSDNVW